MKHVARLLMLISVSSLFQPTFLSTATGADCYIDCMQRSGCWSGRSVSDPSGCNNMPQLCRIQCQGKGDDNWGAIAYSTSDTAAGWSFKQGDKASAERVALQSCKEEGGAKCMLETSFKDGCGAVAADGNAVGWAIAGSQPEARQSALAECGKQGGKKCIVEASVCAATGASTAAHSSSVTPARGGTWGAIAYSSKDMGAGSAQGKADRASAEKEAMARCAQRGKACILQTAFNKQCGALAADRDFTGFGTSADQREAQQKAIDACRKAGGTRCMLHIMVCSM
jgi:Domain of unknown function (DUF4189)